MAQPNQDPPGAVAGAASAPQVRKSDTYDHLPDLSADVSMSADNATRPTFEQLNATLISRGYLRSPLNVAGMRQDSLAALADALHAMIAQREEDIEVRTALTAKNRTLAASLERTKRFQNEELERSADFERKAEASKAKLAHLTLELEAERTAHKATKEALGRMRRDLQAVKSSALQYKVTNDRSVARVRARIGEVTSSAIRSAVPDFQIVASAFDDPPSASSSRAGAAGLYAQQVQELEDKRTQLVEYNQALKRFATEAINAARRADQELLDMVEAEEEDAKKRKSASAAKMNSNSNSPQAASPTSSAGTVALKRSSPSDAWLDGHRSLFQRDLFPANDTLRSTSAGTLVSASSSKAQHPALHALEYTLSAIRSHIQSLLDLRTERTIHEAALGQRISAELKEQAWSSQLEQEIHESLQADARLSLNKLNGPSQVGSLASAAIAASDGSSAGGTIQRIDWQREKGELEKKLAQLIKQLAVAEQNALRNAKEAKKLAEAEQRARSLLDQTASTAAAGKESMATNPSEPNARAESLKTELEKAYQQRDHLAQRCEVLEAHARELRSERDCVLSPQRHAQAESAGLVQASRVTKVKRLDDVEVAAIHARDQKLRSDLGSLSVVAEAVEMPSLSSTVETDETVSQDLVNDAEASTSRRSASKSKGSKESSDTDMVSFSNNPELDAIFGVGKPYTRFETAKVSEAAPRRSSRLSTSSSASAEDSKRAKEPQADERKRKAEQEEPMQVEELSSTGKRRTSGRISDSSGLKSALDQISRSASKRARVEPSAPSSSETVTKGATNTGLKASTDEAVQSRRRLSTREKQEKEQGQKQQRTLSTVSAAATKTPAPSSRRIVSATSSSVTRPTAASLRRSEAVQASSTKRPLSNATNTRQGVTQATTTSKSHGRVVSSSSSVGTRS